MGCFILICYAEKKEEADRHRDSGRFTRKLKNKIRNYCAGRLKKITGNEIALKNSRSWPT